MGVDEETVKRLRAVHAIIPRVAAVVLLVQLNGGTSHATTKECAIQYKSYGGRFHRNVQ